MGIKAFVASLFDPIPVLSLVCVRVAFGLFGYTKPIEDAAVFQILEEMVLSGQGANWDGIKGFFPYRNFNWLFDLFVYFYANYPEFMVRNFVAIMAKGLKYSALAYTVGFCSPISGPLFFLFYNINFFGMGETRFVNHYYMKGLIIFLLCCTNAGKSWSVDSILWGLWRKCRGKKAEFLGPKTCPKWNIWILRMQVAVVFIFGTTTKIQPDWLRGEPWTHYLSHGYRTRAYVRWILDYLLWDIPDASRYFALFISYAGIFYDATIIPLLLYLAVRPLNWSKNYQSLFVFLYIVVSSVVFHTSNAMITLHIGQFPKMTVVLYSLFLPYDWPYQTLLWLFDMIKKFGLYPTHVSISEAARLLNKKKSRKSKKSSNRRQKSKKNEPSSTTQSLSWYQWMVVVFIIVYVASQLMIPCIHWLDTHLPLWGGYKFFGWRMMMTHYVVHKAELLVNHPESNRTMISFPLTDFRISDAFTSVMRDYWYDSEQVVAVAHHIADAVEKQHGERPRVYADVICSLNKRTPQSRFKPGVDLAQEPLLISSFENRWFLEDQLPLSEEQWQQIPQPFLYLIRLTNFPLWG